MTTRKTTRKVTDRRVDTSSLQRTAIATLEHYGDDPKMRVHAVDLLVTVAERIDLLQGR